jgi:hypothetical protein
MHKSTLYTLYYIKFERDDSELDNRNAHLWNQSEFQREMNSGNILKAFTCIYVYWTND